MFTISCMKYAAQYQLPILTLKTPLIHTQGKQPQFLQYNTTQAKAILRLENAPSFTLLCTTNWKFGITPIQGTKNQTQTGYHYLKSELNQHEILLFFFIIHFLFQIIQ